MGTKVLGKTHRSLEKLQLYSFSIGGRTDERALGLFAAAVCEVLAIVCFEAQRKPMADATAQETKLLGG